MDEIKKLTEDRLNELAAIHGFNTTLIAKDYYITVILYLLKDIQGVFFKGGTALQKIFLNYARLSEDIDFTVTGNLNNVRNKILKILFQCTLFERITSDKEVDGFVRLVVHYKDFRDEEDHVFIDLNGRATVLKKVERHKINHFYDEEIPQFSVITLSQEELFAEKMAATISRNKPRDYFDLYKIIGANMSLNVNLVKKKCKQGEFDIIKMCSNAKKLKNRWDEDMLPLISEEVTFQEVMRTLSTYFKLKEVKKNAK